MPIYEYRCEACGNRLELMQKISDAPLKTCPACKKRRLRKLVSATAFHLKGSGWYETDFKNANKPKRPGGDESKADTGAAAGNKDSATPATGSAGADAGKTKDKPPAKAAPGGD